MGSAGTGWLPSEGVRVLRVLGVWFEVANVDELLRSLADRPAEAEFRLALATVWRGSARWPVTASCEPRSPSRPGRTRADRAPARYGWACARDGRHEPGRLATRPGPGPRALSHCWSPVSGSRRAARWIPAIVGSALSLLGPAALRAATVEEMAGGLPPRAGWVLAGVTAPADLWRAEQAWLARVERDGLRLLRTSSLDSGTVLGALAAMACDAWRVRAALEIAAHGGESLEAYDELA